MGLADLRPFPIPLLVRYELIDSRALAARAYPSAVPAGCSTRAQKSARGRKTRRG